MSTDNEADASQQWPRELTPEEARTLRARYLAQAKEAASAGQGQDHADNESTDATVAAFVLPGD